MRKSSGGFTLVELIIVIVILGILAVTAAPKFMNLQGDAKAASLKGLQGALNSAKSLVYGKATLAGVEKSASDTEHVKVNGSAVGIVYGYPAATEAALELVLDVDLTATSGTAGDFFIKVDGTTVDMCVYASGLTACESTCKVTYTQATSATSPATVVATTTGC